VFKFGINVRNSLKYDLHNVWVGRRYVLVGRRYNFKCSGGATLLLKDSFVDISQIIA
jgi:hypothetical protein